MALSNQLDPANARLMGGDETTNVCSEFAENWTVTGYKYFYFSNGLRKAIWFILLLVGVVFSVYLFYGTIEDYLERNTYNLESTDFNVLTLDFPTITICNINALNIKKAKEKGLVSSVPQFQKLYSALVHKTSDSSDVNVKWFTRKNISTVKDAYHVFAPTYDDMTDIEIIRRITPKGACLFNSSTCDTSEITETLLWGRNMQLCAQFNSYDPNGETKTLSSSEIYDGLKMMFHIDSDNVALSNVEYQGLQVFIHPYGTPHLISEYTDEITLQPGTMNIIRVDPRTVTYLPAPYSTDCVESSPFSIIKNYPYSKAMCEVDHILSQVYEKCNCVGFEFEGFVGDTPICNIKQMKCYVEYIDEYKKTRPENSKRSCSLECTTTKYSIRVDQSTIGNNDIYERINNIDGWNKTKQETAIYIRENIVGLMIGYNTIVNKTTTVTASVTWTGLLGEIGGNLGLVLGLSIMTAVELFIFLFDVFRSCRKKDETANTTGDIILK